MFVFCVFPFWSCCCSMLLLLVLLALLAGSAAGFAGAGACAGGVACSAGSGSAGACATGVLVQLVHGLVLLALLVLLVVLLLLVLLMLQQPTPAAKQHVEPRNVPLRWSATLCHEEVLLRILLFGLKVPRAQCIIYLFVCFLKFADLCCAVGRCY